jgi:hypothetical protein
VAIVLASTECMSPRTRCLTALTRASSVAPGCDFRTGCLTVLTVASTDIQLWAATKSLSSEFRSADRRDFFATSRARFSRNLCPGCAPAGLNNRRNRGF